MLGLALLCGVSGEETKALSGAELEKKVEENIENQDYLREKGTQVIAQIIKQEPQAEIASGTGDVSVTGGSQRCHIPFLKFVGPAQLDSFGFGRSHALLDAFWGKWGMQKPGRHNCHVLQGGLSLHETSSACSLGVGRT